MMYPHGIYRYRVAASDIRGRRRIRFMERMDRTIERFYREVLTEMILP